MMYDIESWVYRWFPEVHLYKDGTDLRVNCPFCPERVGKYDVKFKLHISLVKQTCHCFRCGYSASWVRLVMDAAGLEYYRAVGELYAKPSIRKFDDVQSQFKSSANVSVPDAIFPNGFTPLYTSAKMSKLINDARIYMIRRGFCDRYWKHYSLGVSEQIGYRVIIPVEHDYWQARAIFPFMEPKYINPKADSGHYLFNAPALHLYEEVVITEGAFSAMAVGENAVALLGKGTKPKIERIIHSPVQRVIVALDADARAESLELALLLLKAGKEVTFWHYDEGDPADGAPSSVRKYTFELEVRERLGIK